MHAAAPQALHDLGQSIWLDNITRDLLSTKTLQKYIAEWSVTGLTSNPTIFNQAITKSAAYDPEIKSLAASKLTDEELFFKLALADLTAAADLFRPIHERTNGVDGFVSLEVSPLLAHDTASTLAAAKQLSAAAARPNLFIKIPGTAEGLSAIEESIFAGIPINVTLLFSTAQYLAAAEAYLRGIERRIAAGLNPYVASVASVFVSRWDGAVAGKVPESLNNRLGIAIMEEVYQTSRALFASPRWERISNAGARRQRVLWASTGTKDPKITDQLYVSALASPYTVNTMPEATLKALADHGSIGAPLATDGGTSKTVLAEFAAAGIDTTALAAKLQDDGAASFVKSWNDLIAVIAAKRKTFV